MSKRRLMVLVLTFTLLFSFAQVLRAQTSDGSFNDSVKLGTYRIQRGDTLWLISQRYRTTIGSLQELNNLSGTMIFSGQQLTVPVQVVLFSSSQAGTGNGSFSDSVKLGTYRIQRGDTLWLISQRYLTTIGSLQVLNDLAGTMIYSGQQFTVPVQVVLQRAQTGAASGSASESSAAGQVVQLTNSERAKAGLPALTDDPALAKVAQAKAEDMQQKGYFSHDSPTYGSPFQMMTSFGLSYTFAAENIAKGYKDASSVMAGWMGSSGHRANILDADLTNIGVGVAGNIWVQMFRTP